MSRYLKRVVPEMTHDEINKALHEARGNCIHRNEVFWSRGISTAGPMPKIVSEFVKECFPGREIAGNDWFRLCPDCDDGGINVGCSKAPSYCNDLNAMAEVEAGFDWKQEDKYEDLLHALPKGVPAWKAPALDRAKAALEVLTKDSDDT